MTKRRTIAVVTGTRAEFGLLKPVMHAIAAHPQLRLQTLVAGLHLTQGTWRDVAAAGFTIDSRVPMQRHAMVGRAADVAAIGRGVAGFGKALDRLRPDVVLVLGDRTEAFAAATAASVGGWRLAHVHGGDRAEGVADEAMRHAISKLAHLHYPATAMSRRRLVRMGEADTRVIRVGSPAVDGLRDIAPADDAPELIVAQHPIGASDRHEQRWMAATLAATANHRRLVMTCNHDPGADGIHAALRLAGITAIHLPRERFVSLLRSARAIVGNSSAGLIEAAVLKTPCVNIGPRQQGREKPGNVIDCDYGQANVRHALRQALKRNLRTMRHPYGCGNAGQRIADHLAAATQSPIPVRKHNTY